MTTSGIHQRVGQARHRIGRAGARGHQHHARPAGRTGIAFGGMHRALFVANENVDKLVVLKQRVVDGKHRAAGITEDVPHALILERAHHHLGAGHFGCRLRLGCRRFTLALAHHANPSLRTLGLKRKERCRPSKPRRRKRSLSFARAAAPLLRECASSFCPFDLAGP